MQLALTFGDLFEIEYVVRKRVGEHSSRYGSLRRTGASSRLFFQLPASYLPRDAEQDERDDEVDDDDGDENE